MIQLQSERAARTVVSLDVDRAHGSKNGSEEDLSPMYLGRNVTDVPGCACGSDAIGHGNEHGHEARRPSELYA
jgi:hypothetical protein